ncbi:hypothetical protein P7K49_035435 [Saguinus oedipus]|uniref:Uncharacterized protein n=1 Tax=Saguinus oedipus TaxID=9490 RepID=A0ABQ9TN92_SAGOE|nr:hypothetical protein P7K49_035435 [Saguinus oedipus]
MLAASSRSRAAWTRALLLQLLLAGPGGCLSRQELFPFGPAHGDLELEDGDDLVSPALELSGALRFYDRSDIGSVYAEGLEGAAGRGRPRSRTDVGVAGGERDPLAAGAPGAAQGLPDPAPAIRRVGRGISNGAGSQAVTPAPRDPAELPFRLLWAASRQGGRFASLACPDPSGLGPGRAQVDFARSLHRARAGAGSQPARGPQDSCGCCGQTPLSAGRVSPAASGICEWTPDVSWQ